MGDAGLPSVTHRERVGQSEVCPGGTETAVLPERRWGETRKVLLFLVCPSKHTFSGVIWEGRFSHFSCCYFSKQTFTCVPSIL